MEAKKPLYLRLSKKNLMKKYSSAREKLSPCKLCPHCCNVDRLRGERGRCSAPNRAVIASYMPHFGEERELVGTGGSGTIFFTYCNLSCVFCQNWEISRGKEGRPVTVSELARIMLVLQEQGCHNVNLVTPTPYVTQIIGSLIKAIDMGFELPLVYNCGGYESISTLKILEGIIDIYMPDFKFSDEEHAQKYAGITNYPAHARASLKEMHRQVGDLKTDESGIAYRGLLVRHLVLPGGLAGTREMINFLSREVSPNCAVNIMSQYYPAYRAWEYPPLDRPVKSQEYRKAREMARAAGLRVLN